MKKKTFYSIGIAVVLLICIITYFKPLSLSDTTRDITQVKMVLCEYGIRNGEPYIDSTNYQTVSEEQNSEILSLFDKYTYRRNLGTLFSDGSMSGLGKETLNIYVYDGVSLKGTIFVASSGEIVVNDKNYSMENAEKFIEQIVEIMAMKFNK